MVMSPPKRRPRQHGVRRRADEIALTWLLLEEPWRREAAGPPHSHGWLDGGARPRNPRPKVVFLFGPGSHIDPTNVWSIDSSRRGDASGVFTFPIFIQFRNLNFKEIFFFFYISSILLGFSQTQYFLIITFHNITHPLVFSIFTWDFNFSSQFSL